MFTVQTVWNWGWVTLTHPQEFHKALELLELFKRGSYTARLYECGKGPVS